MTGNSLQHADLGIVLIGRNEGDRLKRCIGSIDLQRYPVTYVDSDSSDDSVAFCRSKGVSVVELDMTIPFTAARARNEGFRTLLSNYPDLDFIQFIDGDCQLVEDWLDKARDFLVSHEDFAAVCGRRQEIAPQHSIYNQLCDIEWNTPVGEAKACGGDVLFRAKSLIAANGYNVAMIAGEEPELCFRLRQANWKIYRLDASMTLHDAAIDRFNQWWRRAKRAGYAYMLGALLHGRSAERYYVRQVMRALFWGFALPLVLILATLQSGWAILLWSIYPLQWLKMAARGPSTPDINRQWAAFNIIGKFAEFSGIVSCLKNQMSSKTASIIEYK